jgi:hypothetical protein
MLPEHAFRGDDNAALAPMRQLAALDQIASAANGLAAERCNGSGSDKPIIGDGFGLAHR